MKHIEITCNSLAECYAKLRESDLIYVSDFGHKAKVTIDIDTKSEFDGSYIQVADSIKIGEEYTLREILKELEEREKDIEYRNPDYRQMSDEHKKARLAEIRKMKTYLVQQLAKIEDDRVNDLASMM